LGLRDHLRNRSLVRPMQAKFCRCEGVSWGKYTPRRGVVPENKYIWWVRRFEYPRTLAGFVSLQKVGRNVEEVDIMTSRRGPIQLCR